ncbi:hypothetical protein [Rhodococcoides fascians]|uniref:hypothetical protein n=1 Tax=Rhodococcoides fascians TaxID=1828 RepID=UPI001D6F73D5|nr:hypothetical protein [Rhodococcus fascians]CAH0130833.1 Histamine oxidase [Rhodococcus fascians]
MITHTRLDMMIDGIGTSVEEIETRRVPRSPKNLHGIAFALQRTPLAIESEAQRVADGTVGRV